MRFEMQSQLEQGARNLLVNCAGCEPGQSVLLVHETEHDGYYDINLLDDIEAVARSMGLHTTTFAVPVVADVVAPCPALCSKMQAADCTIFLARLGDQIRFRNQDASKRQIISYALDRSMLASPFGTVDYNAFDALKGALNAAISSARVIRLTCTAGTDVTGSGEALGVSPADVTRKRFPVSVFSPVPAKRFSGRVAQRGFLTGTGSHYYSPWSCEVQDTLYVHFDGTKITRFEGSDRDVSAAYAHYDRVGAQYGLDTYHMHSWHAGIHPGCAYHDPAGQHFERWSGSAFGNPRILHFHTCGDYPPGEISLNVLDPTISLDGVAVWEDGVLHPERILGGDALLAQYPDMAEAFRHPATHVGQAACGQLRYS